MPTDDSHRVITEILEVFSRNSPVTSVAQLVNQNVFCKMDRVHLNMGRDGLQTWFRYLHARMRARQIAVEIEIGTITFVGAGRYDVHGTAVSRHADGSIEKRPVDASYLIENGKISAIWSTRSNYVCVLGRSIELPLYSGYLYHCLRAWFYRISSVAYHSDTAKS